MRIQILNAMDQQGGAAIATYRLFQALRRAGADVSMSVQAKSSDDPGVLGPSNRLGQALGWLRPRLDQLALGAYPSRAPALFSPALVPGARQGLLGPTRPDLLHASWITAGFLSPHTLARFGLPVVWTLHDMWPFTGGCHYSGACVAFEARCGACPALGSGKEKDLSRRLWLRKREAWQRLELTVIAPSRWLGDCARRSSLFRDRRVEVIPNCIDTDVYKPADQAVARNVLGLPADRPLVMLLAERAISDPRKGHDHLVAAIRILAGARTAFPVEVVIVGESRPSVPVDLGVSVHYLGKLNDDAAKVLAYSAADAVVTPSIQENLSNAVMESLACGTPVVAFDIGGMPDLIKHRVHGYLARPFEVADLAEGIAWTTESADRRRALGLAARRHVVDQYGSSRIAALHLDLYEAALRATSSHPRQPESSS